MPLRKTLLIAALAALYFGPGLLFFYAVAPEGSSFWPGPTALAQTAGGAGEPAATAVLVSPEEPGEPLRVTGTVYGPDGTTPAAGVDLYAYHTDAEGLCSETNDNTDPRLEATVRTGAAGRYQLRTIRPAPYPGGGVPAHIHFRISGGGFPDQRADLHFEGDPHLSERARARSAEHGRFGSIRPLEKDADGAWQVVFDLRLRR